MAPKLVQKTLNLVKPASAAAGNKLAPVDVDGPAAAVPEPPAQPQKRSREVTELSGGNGALDLASFVVEPGWATALAPLFKTSTFSRIEAFLAKEYEAGKEIFPPKSDIFAAFNYTPWTDVRVVLIGQDPYHDDGQAHGLCFSVPPKIKPPPSLANMYKELVTDIPGFKIPAHGDLVSWAKQGILMLNATLTVQAHCANSHAQCGWQIFTEDVIKLLNSSKTGLVFLLWGGFARKKAKLIDATKHAVIECAHPSPLSATHWFGCKTFSKCNDALVKLGKAPIDWTLPDKV